MLTRARIFTQQSNTTPPASKSPPIAEEVVIETVPSWQGRVNSRKKRSGINLTALIGDSQGSTTVLLSHMRSF